MGKAPAAGSMHKLVCLTSNKHLLVCTKSRSSKWKRVGKLTGLNAGRDGQQRHNEAQATIDPQEDLVEKAGLWMSVVHEHEHHATHCHREQHQRDQSQRRIPQFIIRGSWAPVERYSKDGLKKLSGFKTTAALVAGWQLFCSSDYGWARYDNNTIRQVILSFKVRMRKLFTRLIFIFI